MRLPLDERPDPLAPPEGYGQKPGAEPEQAEDSATCVHGPCDSPALWRFFWGDGAEHIARLCLCASHAMVFWLRQLGGIICTKCGHPMTLIRIESMRDGTDWPLKVPEDLPPFPQDLLERLFKANLPPGAGRPR